MSKRATFLVTFLAAFFVVGVGQALALCNGQTATITGTNGNDVINGTAGVDVIEALNGDDTINGLGANDVICAGDGYDTIVGGAGNDWIDGGAGADLVDYTNAPGPVTVNLNTGTATGDGTDTIANVSDAYGSWSYADVITGNANSNYLVGWGDADFIYGLGSGDTIQSGDGNDTIEGGAGNDNIQGGNGTDTVSYENAAGAVTVSLATGSAQNTVNDGTDTLSSMENLVGSSAGDTLTGSTGANNINGMGGADTISGGDGNDVLTGGAGQDILHGQNNDDILHLDEGATDSGTTSTCGSGTDIVNKDATDNTDADCETVVVAGDSNPPTASLGGFTEVSGNAYQHAIGATMWINPTQTGSFSVDVTATDAESGMQRVEYPALGTGWSPGAGNDNSSPYTYVYTWSVAPTAPGLKNAVARDNGNNTTNVPFTVASDNVGPASASITYIDGYTGAASANVTFNAGTDAGAGYATHQLQRRSATLTGTSCGSYGSWSNIGAADVASPYADATIANNNCYQYRLNTTDHIANTTTVTGTGTLKVETTAPTGLAVADVTGNTHIDGVAVLTWTGATDSQSGISHYEVKTWPDGAAEPADSEFRSTGSSANYANVRIGMNPTTSPWDWKFRVRAVDNAGNKTSSSSVVKLDDPTNQATGTTGDQSTTDIGAAGIAVGHTTGNLSISNTDVSTKAYGVDLVVTRTYNHQNIQLQPVIGDNGWTNSPAPSDNHSYTSQWAFGFHTHASFEQRLVSGDDGTADGHAEALTFIDETGTNWPFTPTAPSATTYASPVGMDDWTLIKNPGSGDYPTCETGGVDSAYALRQKGGATKCFDAKGRLLRETMRNGRSISYTRNGDGRVTEIAADDPDGGGGEQPLKLTLSYNGDKRVSKISDQLGRETRYDYVNYSGMYYLETVRKYSDSGSSTALTRTDYAWDSAGSRRIIDVDEWIYADDPGTGTSNDPLKHHFDIAYSAANRVDTITEIGTSSRAVGSGSQTLPAVADTITEMDYMSLTPGGSAATLSLDVKTGTAADDDAFGIWTYTLDSFGRPIETKKPLESGAGTRAESTVTYTPEGRIEQTQTDRSDITTTSYDTAGDTIMVDVDHATSGVPNTTTTYEDHTALGDAEKETALRSPDGTFLAKWPYVLNECVDAGGGGTFKVAVAGTSGSTSPTWPGSGTVVSGTVTFDKQGCTPTPQGVETLHEYDANGNETQQTDAKGVRTCSYYTAFGAVDIEYKLDGADCPGSPNASARIKGTLVDHTYSAKGFLAQTITDESTTKFTHDDAGQKTEERLVVDSGDSSKDIVTSTTYDGAGRAIRETTVAEDGSVRNTSSSYSLAGGVTSVTVPNSTHPTGLSGGNPAGDVTTARFNARGLGYLETRPDNTIVTRKYDGRNNEAFVSVPHAQNNSTPAGTVISYFHSGVKKTKEDPAGVITTYDPSVTIPGADERPLKIDSPVAGETTFTYNANGDEATRTTPAGTFTYVYDGNGNRAKTTYPNGDVLVEIRDRQGKVIERRFSPNGGGAEVDSSTYSPIGNVLTDNQDSGIDTVNTYSTETGQLTKTELDDDGSAWTQEVRYAYDAAGRLDDQTLENGGSDLVTDYVYENKSGRVKRIEHASGMDERYVYDQKGRVSEQKVIKRSDSSWQGGDTYAYDAQDRVTSRTRREGGTSFATAFTYDSGGQLTSEASAAGIVHEYVYRNANNQDAFGVDLSRETLHATAAPTGSLSLARVDEIELCLTTASSCGAGDEAAIDTAIAQLAEPGTTLDPTTLTSTAADVARWLKLRNNRLNWGASTAFPVGTCIAPNGWQWERYKVTTAGTSGASEPTWPSSGTVSDGSVTWTKTTCTPVLVLRTYTYDSGSPSKHQLVKTTSQIGVEECYSYDSRGNQNYRGACPATTPNQTWDVYRRPTQLKIGGSTMSIVWGAAGENISSWSYQGLTRSLEYDADDHIVSITATGSSSWTLHTDYDRSGLAGYEVGGTRYYLDRSLRGDVTAVRSSAGSGLAKLRYSAFGSPWSDDAQYLDYGFGFGGADGTLYLGGGIYWMQHRIYDSSVGRFLSVDPEEAVPGSLMATYNYANNNPSTLSDPQGTHPVGFCSSSQNIYSGAGARITAYSNVYCDVLTRYLSSWRQMCVQRNFAGYWQNITHCRYANIKNWLEQTGYRCASGTYYRMLLQGTIYSDHGSKPMPPGYWPGSRGRTVC